MPRGELEGRRLVVGVDHYDSESTATLGSNGLRLEGRRQKTAGVEGRWAEAHERLRTRFEEPIEELLDEAAAES